MVLRVRALRRLEVAYLLFAVAEFGTWVAVLVFAYQHGGAALAGVAAAVQLLPAQLLLRCLPWQRIVSAVTYRFDMVIWLNR